MLHMGLTFRKLTSATREGPPKPYRTFKYYGDSKWSGRTGFGFADIQVSDDERKMLLVNPTQVALVSIRSGELIYSFDIAKMSSKHVRAAWFYRRGVVIHSQSYAESLASLVVHRFF
jgi:hypothetical protein